MMAYQNRSHKGTPDAPGEVGGSFSIIATGTYMGNNPTDVSVITGFQPKVIMIFNLDDTASSRMGGTKIDPHTTNEYHRHDGSLANGITINVDGFTVDTQYSNDNGDQYAYVAWS